jgi:putative hydrolase of the HAD superfamily
MKVLVFDADGVLCVGSDFGRALELEHGIPRERLAAFFRGPFRDCIEGRRDLKEALIPFLPEWGWSLSVDQLLSFWFERENVICPKALACVRKLRRQGHRCVLGTNQEKYRTDYLRREMGFGDDFDHVFSSCEVGAAKPSRGFFAGIEHRFGLPGGEFCLIDDSEENLIGAKASGWRTIRYHGEADLEKIESIFR